MQVTALSISKEKRESPFHSIDYYCHTEGYEYFSHYPRLKTVERIEYLARRRNQAVEKALSLFPQTTHIFMIDTYYLDQTKQMIALIEEYKQYKDSILGASTWYIDPSKILKHKWYWDTWTNPEFLHKGPDYYPLPVEGIPHGWQATNGAGGFCIFP